MCNIHVNFFMQALMELESVLQPPQQLAAGPYLEPDESSPRYKLTFQSPYHYFAPIYTA
jgi:hypothetical protein